MRSFRTSVVRTFLRRILRRVSLRWRMGELWNDLNALRQETGNLHEETGKSCNDLNSLSQQIHGLDVRLQAASSEAYVAETARDMQNYQEQVTACYGTLTNPFSYYERLVDELLQIRDLEIVPLCQVQAAEGSGKRIIGLRHDVDADPVTALRAARHLARRGICGSFFLLHTAPYYGDFIRGVFVRNARLVEWIKGFIVAGCELGLHNDALGICTVHGKDGAEAVREEIAWLRSQGARIYGTVSHNSAPAYGAENLEVFREGILWDRKVVSARGVPLPLGRISMQELQLTYEGTFAKPKKNLKVEEANDFCSGKKEANIRSETWMRRYLLDNPCIDWAIHYQFWLVGKDSWVVAGRFGGEKLFAWDVSLDQVISRVGSLPEGSRSVMLIHPCYVRG